MLCVNLLRLVTLGSLQVYGGGQVCVCTYEPNHFLLPGCTYNVYVCVFVYGSCLPQSYSIFLFVMSVFFSVTGIQTGRQERLKHIQTPIDR